MTEIRSPLFASLPEAALERIRQEAHERHFAAGEAMLSEGEHRGELFVIARGEGVVIGRDWHGQPQTLARIGPGECFGELSMLSGEPASATVEAGCDTDVLVLPHNDVVAIAEEYPELDRNISALLAERLRLSNDRHLRAQRGRLTAIFTPDAPEWAFWLAYRVAHSVARHTCEATVFLDFSGRASEWLTAPVHSLADAASAQATNGQEPVGLQAVSAGDDAASEKGVGAALERLLDRARHVVSFVPRGQYAGLMAAQSDANLVLLRDAELEQGRAALDVGPTPNDGKAGVAVLADWDRAPTVGDVRGAQTALGGRWRVRGVIPGGERGLQAEPAPDSLRGRAIDRLARSVSGCSVGLALGAGGAKGYAHIGVVRALQRAGVPFDCVTGCSIGAPLAAGIVDEWDLDTMRQRLNEISAKAVRPNLPVISILSSSGLRAELRDVSGERHFDAARTPLGIVAVDIETGEEVVLRSGPVWLAMMASMAYPGIYEPVRIGRRQLVDGGVMSPVPVTAAVTLGADVVISSNLSGGAYRPAAADAAGPPRPRLIVESIARSLEIMQRKIVEESCARADVSIEPEFDDPPGLLDFKRGRLFEDQGEAAAEQMLPRIRSLLPWLARR